MSSTRVEGLVEHRVEPEGLVVGPVEVLGRISAERARVELREILCFVVLARTV